MKRIQTIIYISLALLLMSCASDIADIVPNDASNNAFESNAFVGIITDVERGGESMSSRSSLIFDAKKKTMQFSWHSTDCAGVFPLRNGGQQQKFIINSLISSTSAKFQTEDPKLEVFKKDDGVQYVSYVPYITTASVGKLFDYSNVPISYLEQEQASNVNIYAYYKRTESDAMYNTYYASEEPASAHLSKYDYLVSKASLPEEGNLNFSYVHMGSIIRFFLQVPVVNGVTSQEVFDSIQIVNNEADFVLTADMNISSSDVASSLTNKYTSHVVSLKFGPSGFDMNNPTGNTSYRDANRAYIIAYMMLSPINLKNKKLSTLYLIGHTQDEPHSRVFYRAKEALSSINFEQGKYYQWTCTGLTDDEPITFEPSTVEQWKADTSLSNSDSGTGTEDW